MRIAALIVVASAVGLAGCGGDSSGDSAVSSTDATAAGGARPVSPNVEPTGAQQAIIDEFSACAEDAGYTTSEGPGIPGGVAVGVTSVRFGVVATFVVFPDVNSAVIAEQRDRLNPGNGVIFRKGFTEVIGHDPADVRALSHCVRAAWA